MKICLLLLSVQLLTTHVKDSECAYTKIELIDTDTIRYCYNTCYTVFGFLSTESEEDCDTCCQGVNPKSTKGTCRRPPKSKSINCYCTAERRFKVEIKELPSCKTECKDMQITPVKREESCSTCCKTFNKSTFKEAKCKRGSFGFAKTETCTCTFYTPIVNRGIGSKRSIGVRGSSRGLSRVGRSNSSSRRQQFY